jgi:drug/metabolite transporter (DMT)-like permease
VKRGRAEAALVFNTLVWGSTFVLVKTALADISPVLFLALRFSLAALVLAILFRRAWRPGALKAKAVGGGVIVGFFLFSGYLFQTLGLPLTSAAKSAFITGLSTVMVPLLAMLVYQNKPTISEGVGILAATAGMALMTLEGTTWKIGQGDILTFICAVGFAAHIVALGHYSNESGYELLSVMQVATAAVLAGALFWYVETPVIRWRPAVIYAILITGLFATALAFTIQAWAQRYTTATRTALIFALEPVFAWATSFLFMGEGLSDRAAAGAALILGGVVLVEMKPLNPRQHPS